MAQTHRVRWTVLAIVLLLVGVVVVVGPNMLASAVRDRSVKVMEQAAGPRSHITIEHVSLELLPGDITWSGLRIEQRIDSADTSWTYGRSVLIAGDVGRIEVKGLSIWKLLARKTIALRELAVHGAQLELISSDRRSHETPDDEKESENLINSIRLDSITVDSSSLHWRNVRRDRPSASAGQVNLKATGLHAVLPHRREPFSLSFTSSTAVLDSMHASLPPLYDLNVAHVRVAHPDSLIQVTGIALTSRKGPQEYSKVIHYENDLITFTSDSIGIRGLDIAALFNQRAVLAGELRISGTVINDFRDKTMPDAPFKVKSLPARLLRQLPFALCLDSFVVDRLDVHYNEKDVVTANYGQVDFTGIDAVVHGLCTVHPDEKPEVHLVATARVYDTAPIHFDFRTAIFDSTDHFSIKAKIGTLPFKVFNAMINDLLLVRTTAGTIGGVDYTFEADKVGGHGRVDVEYSDLKLRIARRDGSRKKNVVKSFLVNQAIRSKNLREGGNFRHGDFTLERKTDRQIFNYMWSGLREGMMETVLPEAMKDAQDAVRAAKTVTTGK